MRPPEIRLASFSTLPLLPTLLATLAEAGLVTQTEIQERTLPPLLEGRSLLGVAETGSGKTLAYVLPLLHQLKTLEDGGSPVSAPGRPRGIVVVPGRELGEQVSRVFKTFTHTTRLRVRVALGGSARQVARQNVSGNFEILVATPGRLEQLLGTKDLHLDDVCTIVFDEADQMLDAGFLPTASKLVASCPPHHQLVLLSATLPKNIDAIVGDLFRRVPIRVVTSGSERVVSTLTTENRDVEGWERFDELRKLIAASPTTGTLVFVNTREQGDKLAAHLLDAGVPFASFRGEMDKNERRANLAAFRDGEISLLIATDLAARGLDIERVERVVNYHLPRMIENYLHRVGRTARAGRAGHVVNFVTDRDWSLLDKLARRHREPAPTTPGEEAS